MALKAIAPVVTISTVNSPPVANAGPNQSVAVGSTVQLNGSNSSDVGRKPLTYSWNFVSIPQAVRLTLTNPTL